MPGKIALKVSPNLFRDLAQQVPYKVVVTGTNGKSTTSGLLVRFFQAHGKKVVHNHLGANMLNGLTTALINASDVEVNVKADIAVLEIDEATLPKVSADLKQDLTLVTNLFRDQLDRYGELDTTAKMIKEGIEKSGGQLLLNADDPIVSQIAEGFDTEKVHYFGFNLGEQANSLNKSLPELLEQVQIPSEVTDCPKCQAKLNYHFKVYGHLGGYFCENCGLTHPKNTLSLKVITDLENNYQLLSEWNLETLDVNFKMSGQFNAYNLLAALSGFSLSVGGLEFAKTSILEGLKNYQSIFGRSEKLTIHDRNVLIYLIKNPIGAAEVLETVSKDENRQVLIMINDDYADGRDISWLWDAPFEWLVNTKQPIMVSGRRAEDMALRLLYGGVPQSKIELIEDTASALEQAVGATKPNSEQTLYVLPTYTALLNLSKALGSR